MLYNLINNFVSLLVNTVFFAMLIGVVYGKKEDAFNKLDPSMQRVIAFVIIVAYYSFSFNYLLLPPI